MIVTYTDGTTQNLGKLNNNTGDATNGVLKFTLLADNTYSVSAGSEAAIASKITIPSTYNNKPVSTIEENAFSELQNLLEVVIPDSVKTIKNKAFYKCPMLEKVSGCNGVTSFGEEVFYYDLKITSIEIPSVCESIGKKCFYGFSDSSTIVINPDLLKYIGVAAFGDATIVWNSDEITNWKIRYVWSEKNSGAYVYTALSYDAAYHYAYRGESYYISATMDSASANSAYKNSRNWARITDCSNRTEIGNFFSSIRPSSGTWIRK